MMIAGFVVTAGIAGHFLDPFSPERLVRVSAVTSAAAFLLAVVAIRGLERPMPVSERPRDDDAEKPPFLRVLAEVWSDVRARRFTVFVFVSMLAYSAQDLIVEPFAGIAFGFTPGESTQLAGLQHGGVLVGMLLFGVAASSIGGRRFGTLRGWTMTGCIASAVALLGLSAAGLSGPPWPLHASIFALGVANGAFAVAAIGMMMDLAGRGRSGREGTRMGLWGAAQAIAFGLGGLLGAAGVDITRLMTGSPIMAYVVVFAVQALLFGVSARLIAVIDRPAQPGPELALGNERA
jgi:BCD family chlorophyll transporter-like MFS transporter